MNTLKLYNYFRSSTSYRVRIALELKKLTYEYIPIHLLNNGGEQNSDDFRKINPMGGVPTLIHDDQSPLAQSSAILEYLDEAFPQSYQLMPKDLLIRAKIREFCQIINSEMHPYGNLKTTQYLENNFKITTEEKIKWLHHWFNLGFSALEKILEKNSQKYCFQNEITAADIYLIPHAVSALRFEFDVSKYQNINRICKTCQEIESFRVAHPFRQIDTPDDLRII